MVVVIVVLKLDVRKVLLKRQTNVLSMVEVYVVKNLNVRNLLKEIPISVLHMEVGIDVLNLIV
jgi:hypothetical protein